MATGGHSGAWRLGQGLKDGCWGKSSFLVLAGRLGLEEREGVFPDLAQDEGLKTS
jgi:hypothetical protein